MKRWKIITAVIVGWFSLYCLRINAQSSDYDLRPQNDRIGEKGPLITNNIYPFYIPFINLIPESAQTLGEGHDRFIIANHYGNTFRYDFGTVRPADNFAIKIDVETSHLSLSYDYGLLPYLDLGLDWSVTAHYGGICDPIIEFFHNFLGFYNSNREYAEDNTFTLQVKSDNGAWLDYSMPILGFGDVQLRAKLELLNLNWDELGFTLALQPAIKIPTGNTDYYISNGKIDFSLQFLITQTLYHSAIYLNAGYIYVGMPDNLKLVNFTNHLFSYVLGLELIVSKSLSLYTQLDGSTSPYRAQHFWLDYPSTTINIGFKNRLNANNCLQVSFSEEFIAFSTTDITLLVALTIEN